MIFAVAIVIGALFGGSDQYLGSIASLPWASGISLLSAPWLVLPFCFGCTQRDPRRAVVVGVVATYSALVGYGVMTLSPLEGVHLSHDGGAMTAFIHSEWRVILGGLVTGPLYGYVGLRWRRRRAWTSAALVAGALCVEPLAREMTGGIWSSPSVWVGEILVGVASATYFGLAAIRHKSQLRDQLHVTSIDITNDARRSGTSNS